MSRTVRLVGGIAALALAAAAAAAWAGDPVIDELIARDKVDATVSAPDPSLPEGVRAWLGRWEGTFNVVGRDQRVALIVKQIEPAPKRGAYRARVVTVWGPVWTPYGAYEGGAFETPAIIDGTQLTCELEYLRTNRRATFTMQPDGRTLQGRQDSRAFALYGALARVADPAEAKAAEAAQALEALRRSGVLSEEQYRQALERLNAR